MNILAGESTVDQLYSLGLVRNPADLYSLSANQLMMLEGWKERSASRFLESLRASVNVPFERVLFALGIRYVGETTAKEIAKHFGSMDAVSAATLEQMLEVSDVGEVIARSIVEYFQDGRHKIEIQRLKAAGLKMDSDAADNAVVSEYLSGMTIVISGNFSISRDEMKSLIASNGGRNSGSVSGKTSFLLAGEKAGPEKLRKADELGIRVVSEAEFMEMIHLQKAHQPGGQEEELTLF